MEQNQKSNLTDFTIVLHKNFIKQIKNIITISSTIQKRLVIRNLIDLRTYMLKKLMVGKRYT